MIEFDASSESEASSEHSVECLEQDEYLESVHSTSEKLCTKMLHQLNEFRQDGTLCDAKLRLEGKEFDVHKVVLSSSCPYFRTLFTANMRERNQSVIDLKCPVDLVDHMNDFLTFLYACKVQLTNENVEALIVAADYFNVTELKELGCRFLQQNVNLSNGIALHGFAGRYHCEPLREMARDFLVENFTAVSQTEEYLLTDPDQLLEIVSSDDIVLFAEEELYEGILRWVKHDLTNRRGFFPELFSKIRLQDVNRNYLAETIANEELVTDDPVCADLFKRTILECYVTEDATNTVPSRFHECVFVNGGREPSGATSLSYLFVPSKNAWFKIPSMSTVRYSHGIATIGEDVFVLGGYSKSGFTAEVESFNVKSRKWSTNQPLPTAMKGMAVAAVGDALYVAGGIVENGIRLGILKRYDSESKRWQVKAPLHVARSGASLVSVGNFLYAIGGKASNNQMLSSVERYSITEDKWEMQTDMSHQRAYAVSASVANSNILVVGGINEVGEMDTIDHIVVIRTYLRSCEMYNTTAEVWFPVADLCLPRAFSGISVHRDKVYVFGGEGTATRYHKSVECYDCTTNKWSIVSQMPEPKKFLQCSKLMLPQGVFRSLPQVDANI